MSERRFLTDRPEGISGPDWAAITGAVPTRFVLGVEHTGFVDIDHWLDHDGGDDISAWDEPLGDAMHWTPNQEDD